MTAISLVNMIDGTVQGHRAGCADLKKNARNHGNQPWTLTVESKNQAWIEYNADFLGECYDDPTHDEAKGLCQNSWEIHWLPCASEVPQF